MQHRDYITIRKIIREMDVGIELLGEILKEGDDSTQ